MTQFAVAQHVELQPIDDCLIALHITRNAYYKLNNSARFFFEQLAAGCSREEIIAEASRIYDADVQTLSADFDASLRQFLDLGLLTACEKSSSHRS